MGQYLERKQIAGMNCHYRFYTLDDFLNSLEASHIGSAELWTCAGHYLLDASGYEDAGKIGKKFKDRGVRLICITPEQNNPKPHNIAAGDRELQRRTLLYFQNAIRAAAELECGLVGVGAGWAFYSEPKQEAWKRSAQMLEKLSRFAEECGVTLALEALQPDESVLVNTCGDIERMLCEVGSEHLKVNLDLGAMARAGESIQKYFDCFGPRIAHCHFVDGNPAGHLAWGDGSRNLEADLKVFLENGYRGYFSMEYASERYYARPWEADRKTMELLEPYIKE